MEVVMNKMIEMVKGKKVNFVGYRKMNLYYETECGFRFPVPIEDTGDATFMASDKAMFFMRYIRKQMALIEKGETIVEEIGLGGV
jgi:predicted GTPase